MGSSWPSLPTYHGEEFGVGGSDSSVVVHNADHFGDVVDELLTGGPVGFISKVDSHKKLGDGNGRNGHLVLVGDEVFECRS